MGELTKLRHFLCPAGPEEWPEVEKRLADEAYPLYRGMSLVIFCMQVLMITLFLLKPGGPFKTLRRTGYFTLYVLLACTAFGFWRVAARIHQKRAPALLTAGAIFSALVCAWTVAVTTLDQLGGNDLIVYSYMLPAVAALAVLRPRHSLPIFFVAHVALNLAVYPMPQGQHNLFSNLVNSSFITTISMFISVCLFRGRVVNQRHRIIIQRQVSEIRRINSQLTRQAMVDNLTGLGNRRYLEEAADPAFRQAIADGRPAAAIMMDIDHFKEYNDQYGHPAGDRTLSKIADCVRALTAPDGCFGVRYGGEEFLLLLLDCDGPAAAGQAERLRRMVWERGIAHSSAPEGRVTVSMGVAAADAGQQCTLEELTERADAALYAAKQAGRNRVVMR